MSVVQPVKKHRLHYLDSARGLAALSVITWHFIAAFVDVSKTGPPVTSPLHLFWYGEADVVFFFIHSGFILAYSYTGINKPLTLINYIRFIIERVFRIYPLFLFILLASFLLKITIFPASNGHFTDPHLHQFWTRNYDLKMVLKEAILVIAIPNEGNLRLLPQDWTLTIELVAGASIPFLGLLARKTKWFYWISVFIAIVFLRFNTYVFEFACGVFIFYKWPFIQNLWKRLNGLLRVTACLVAVVLYTCLFYFPSLFNYSRVLFRPGVDRFIVATGCCVLFAIIISSIRMQKLLSLPWLVSAGRICYSIYLVHMVLLICFADYLMQQLHIWLAAGSLIYWLICYIVFIAATILISMATYSLVEKPFNRFGKKVSLKVGGLLTVAIARSNAGSL